jgi:hypothetical protein
MGQTPEIQENVELPERLIALAARSECLNERLYLVHGSPSAEPKSGETVVMAVVGLFILSPIDQE